MKNFDLAHYLTKNLWKSFVHLFKGGGVHGAESLVADG